MTRACAICSETGDSAKGWVDAILDEDIRWRSAFVNDGDMPVTPAGAYQLCAVCATWRPDARTRALPAAVKAGIEAAVVAGADQPRVRRRLRAELVGAARHLAGRLKPAVDG